MDPATLKAMQHLDDAGFGLLPLDGKSPLIGFKGKRITLIQSQAIMARHDSSAYGVRLPQIAVADVDERSQELFDIVTERLGVSPVEVNTPRGRHFYFNNPQNIRHNFKAEGLNIDFKTGVNSYVAGPYSKRLDGGFYEPEKGLLGVDTLPTIEGPLNGPLSASGTVLRGGRNNYLTKFAKDHVLYVDSLEELAENLRNECDLRCEAGFDPVTDYDIMAKAKWAWKLRQNGNVWGGEQVLKVKTNHMKALQAAPRGPDAMMLFLQLESSHRATPDREFVLDHAGMQETGLVTYGRDKFRDVVELLVRLGLIKKINRYKVCGYKQHYRLMK